MNDTVQILQDLVRNTRTGRDAAEQLMHRSESPRMRRELNLERERYLALQREAEKALRDAGGSPEPAGIMDRAGMKLGLEINTLANRSDGHIAEMVIQGATMGIIEMTKSMNACAEADPSARSLASHFIVQQNEFIERQKSYLQTQRV